MTTDYRRDTIQYYNDKAADFIAGTRDVDMSEIYAHFENYLEAEAKLLDLGCGSGRDANYFAQKGYRVVAVDGSKELCEYVSQHFDLSVRCADFTELDYSGEFDAVWACASLLHLNEEDLRSVIKKIRAALKPGGILYTSFKYGDGSRVKGKRFFLDCNESKVSRLFNEGTGFRILETFITTDVREDRADEKWINIILEARGQ